MHKVRPATTWLEKLPINNQEIKKRLKPYTRRRRGDKERDRERKRKSEWRMLQASAHWLLRCRQGGRVRRSWAFSVKGRRHFDLHARGQDRINLTALYLARVQFLMYEY